MKLAAVLNFDVSFGRYICTFLGRQSRSKVAVALLANRRYQ